MTTKEQELKALTQIKKIVDGLGEDSYIGTAFDGCFEIAETNIDNDWACSMKQRAESAEKKIEMHKADTANLLKAIAEKDRMIERLKQQLELEQEWKPYIDTDNYPQERYDELRKAGRVMTDDEAKEILYDWYGFAKEKITILHSVPKLEVNRHRQLRKVGEIERLPLYEATDWNYIRFDCGCMSYELVNDQLRPWMH